MFKVWKQRSKLVNISYYVNFALAALFVLNFTIEGFKSRSSWKTSGKLALGTLALEFLVDAGFCLAMWWLGEPKIHHTVIHDLLVATLLLSLFLQEQSAWTTVSLMTACICGIAVYSSPYIGCVTAMYALIFAVLAVIRSKFTKRFIVTLVCLALLVANAAIYPSLFGIVNWQGKRHWDLEAPVHALVLGVVLPLFLLRK
jgi:hypothetical protein